MKIVFLGTPQEVVGVLAHLSRADQTKFALVGVVTQPARPVGRSGDLQDPPVARFAKSNGILTLQPEKASDPKFLDELRALNPDVMITAAYGQILTEEFLKNPMRGTINIHPSLLPRYRGATPVQSALLNGDQETGVSILFTVKKLDAGNIILQKTFAIAPHETADVLLQRLFDASGDLLTGPDGALERLRDRAFEGVPQDTSKVVHCKKFDKADGNVDWAQPALSIYNRFRAFFPWPGLFTSFADKRIGLLAVLPAEKKQQLGDPGKVIYAKDEKKLYVNCGGSSWLEIVRLQPAGGKPQDAAAFWNGVKNKDDVRFTRLGSPA